MSVQELIDELQKVKDKSLPVVAWVEEPYDEEAETIEGSIDIVMVQGAKKLKTKKVILS